MSSGRATTLLLILALAGVAAGVGTAVAGHRCRPVAVTVYTLSAFRLPPVAATTADVPADLLALDGRRVAVVGFVQRGFSGAEFELVDLTDLRTHPSDGGPSAERRVVVRPVPGTPAAKWKYSPNAMRVTGTLHVAVAHNGSGPEGRSGTPSKAATGVYAVDADRVEDASAPVVSPAWVTAGEYGGGVAAAAAALPLVAMQLAPIVRHVRGRRRAAAGRCARCGHDQRATPDQCTECGWVGDYSTWLSD